MKIKRGIIRLLVFVLIITVTILWIIKDSLVLLIPVFIMTVLCFIYITINSSRAYLKSNILHILEIILIAISAKVIYDQLSENMKQNSVSIRGQLYQTEYEFSKDARLDDILNVIYLSVPINKKGTEFSYSILKSVTNDTLALKSTSAKELYEIISGYDTFIDPKRREATKDLRRVFLYSSDIFYHIHNAFDYKDESILDSVEWNTWKGSIREMSANPIFLAVVWNGYKYDYFSKKFATFLYNEIATEYPLGLKNKSDTLDYMRDREFIGLYYKDMLDTTWATKMPD